MSIAWTVALFISGILAGGALNAAKWFHTPYGARVFAALTPAPLFAALMTSREHFWWGFGGFWLCLLAACWPSLRAAITREPPATLVPVIDEWPRPGWRTAMYLFENDFVGAHGAWSYSRLRIDEGRISALVGFKLICNVPIGSKSAGLYVAETANLERVCSYLAGGGYKKVFDQAVAVLVCTEDPPRKVEISTLLFDGNVYLYVDERMPAMALATVVEAFAAKDLQLTIRDPSQAGTALTVRS